MPHNICNVDGKDHVDYNGKDCELDDFKYRQSLKCEEVRLKTFKLWPASVPVQPDQLAQDGFYYLNLEDRVKCIFCNLILRSWEPGDVVRTEHLKFNSLCPFLLQENVGNIPIHIPPVVLSGNTLTGKFPHVPSGSDFMVMPKLPPVVPSGSALKKTFPYVVSSGSALMIVPKFPEFSKPAARVVTFDKMIIPLTQTPEELAKAGFFYQGHPDSLRCYNCGVLLKNWAPADDPWDEHQHWSPECEHLKQRPIFHDRYTETAVIKKAVEMGYEKLLIEHAVGKRHRNHSGDFNDIKELMDELEYLRIQQQTVSKNPCISKEIGIETGSQKSVVITGTAGATSCEEYKNMEDLKLCKICQERELEVTFIPCGHFVACETCGHKLLICPICRQQIRGMIRTFW